MRDFEALSAAFFRDFESYRIHVGLLSWFTLLLSLSFLWFIIGSYILFEKKSEFHLIVSEVILLGSWKWMLNYRQSKVLKSLNKRWGTSYTKINRAQAEWLNRSIAAPATEYFKIARDISEAYKLQKLHRVNFTLKWEDVLRFAYDPDSKARVLSLTIFLLSLVSVLLARYYDDGQIPFEILLSDGFLGFLGTLMFFGFIVWLLVLGARVSLEFISALILGVIEGISSGTTSSKRSKNRLIQALLVNHEIPKIRHKSVSAQDAHAL